VIAPEALQALHDLQGAGLTAIAVTGRPVGWSVPCAHHWPLHALVAENGAVALLRESTLPPALAAAMPADRIERLASANGSDALLKLYQQDATTRARNHARLQQVAALVQRAVPGTVLARDSAGRETDIAIDHSEFTQLPAAQIAQVVAVMQAAGLNASVSSIHINGWIGEHDKWQGARWIARELLGRELPAEIERWVYVGDSTNDQVMFQHFTHSVGVANIRRFEHALRHRPRYITQGERGAGFAEVVRRLLAARSAKAGKGGA
jgi:hydroxymethylpyrimidine pyrophosphatase-like HAD family hydrolase